MRRLKAAGLSWPRPEDMDDAALERRLFANTIYTPASERPLPDWSRVHHELKRKGVTLPLLWQKAKATRPDGFQYSDFCDAYRTMRPRSRLPADYLSKEAPMARRSPSKSRRQAPS